MEEPLADLDLDAPERTAFRALLDGEEVGTGELILRAEDDRTFVQEVRGEAFDRLAGEAVVEFRRRAESLHAESQRLRLEHRGKEVYSESVAYRDVKVPQLGGEVAAYPRTMVPAAGLAVALRTLPWKDKARFTPPVWLTLIVHWPLDLRVEGKGRIEVPAGRFDAWKIRIRPSLSGVAQTFDELSATLIPPVHAHVDQATNRLVALDFPTGTSRHDPPGRLEATEL